MLKYFKYGFKFAEIFEPAKILELKSQAQHCHWHKRVRLHCVDTESNIYVYFSGFFLKNKRDTYVKILTLFSSCLKLVPFRYLLVKTVVHNVG